MKKRIELVCGKAVADRTIISVAIAFPHCLFKDNPPTDLPADAILTMDDLSQVEAAILRAYKAGGGGKRREGQRRGGEEGGKAHEGFSFHFPAGGSSALQVQV